MEYLDIALSMLNLIGPGESVVDALHKRGDAVAGVQTLVGVHLARHVGVASHLQQHTCHLSACWPVLIIVSNGQTVMARLLLEPSSATGLSQPACFGRPLSAYSTNGNEKGI